MVLCLLEIPCEEQVWFLTNLANETAHVAFFALCFLLANFP